MKWRIVVLAMVVVLSAFPLPVCADEPRIQVATQLGTSTWDGAVKGWRARLSLPLYREVEEAIWTFDGERVEVYDRWNAWVNWTFTSAGIHSVSVEVDGEKFTTQVDVVQVTTFSGVTFNPQDPYLVSVGGEIVAVSGPSAWQGGSRLTYSSPASPVKITANGVVIHQTPTLQGAGEWRFSFGRVEIPPSGQVVLEVSEGKVTVSHLYVFWRVGEMENAGQEAWNFHFPALPDTVLWTEDVTTGGVKIRDHDNLVYGWNCQSGLRSSRPRYVFGCFPQGERADYFEVARGYLKRPSEGFCDTSPEQWDIGWPFKVDHEDNSIVLNYPALRHLDPYRLKLLEIELAAELARRSP